MVSGWCPDGVRMVSGRCLDPNFFWKNIFWTQIFFGPKIFWVGKNIFCPPPPKKKIFLFDPTFFDNDTAFPMRATISTIKESFKSEQAEYLKNECEQQSKLRTFIKFKQFGILPAYVTKPLSFFQRKHIAKLRLGSLEIRIESGRFSRPHLEIHERICCWYRVGSNC